MLGIIDHGKLSVSDKTALPTGKTLRSIAESLPGGDFYAEQNGKDDDGTPAGPIKAFAWPMLLQAAGLAQRNGSKLGLTKAGVQATGAAPADTVRAIWQAWLKTTQLDEFSRVDFIKGQKTRSNVMTAVPPRRAVIAKALKRCRTEVWISVDEFSRCMQAENDRFELCRDPWDLYLADREYGSLGYEGGGDWNILQLRYLLCLLFEYCATLGMVDIAYIAPAYARDDYHELWGGQDYDYLSRYDGLMYFRLNALGAYCLGMRSSYTPPVAQVTGRLAAHASLQIELIEGELTTNDLVQLENWAEPESPRHWRLSREKSVAAIERGHDIAHLLALLQRYDRQPLPSAIESFVRACSRQGRALTVVGNALLIECVDAETADLIAAHKPLAALCLRAGARHLVVRSEHEVKFRHATRAFGYGIVQ